MLNMVYLTFINKTVFKDDDIINLNEKLQRHNLAVLEFIKVKGIVTLSKLYPYSELLIES